MYIDVEKLKIAIKNNFSIRYFTPTKEDLQLIKIFEIINTQPTADVDEVKHGEWLWNKGRGWGEAFYFCSLCAGDGDSGEDNYCPNCGAKMDGRSDSE